MQRKTVEKLRFQPGDMLAVSYDIRTPPQAVQSALEALENMIRSITQFDVKCLPIFGPLDSLILLNPVLMGKFGWRRDFTQEEKKLISNALAYLPLVDSVVSGVEIDKSPEGLAKIEALIETVNLNPHVEWENKLAAFKLAHELQVAKQAALSTPATEAEVNLAVEQLKDSTENELPAPKVETVEELKEQLGID